MAGAPKGNKNARKAKVWTEALKKALRHYHDEDVQVGTALYRIAWRVVRDAIHADHKDGYSEIANRLEGKATEHVEISTDREIHQYTDDELIAIAFGSRDGVSGEEGSSPESPEVH